MKKAKMFLSKLFASFRTCRYCGYSGSDWKDDDECPACGEVN